MSDNDRFEVTVTKESNAGCLILMIDFAAITVGIGLMLSHYMHMVFGLLIGLAITIVFVLLARLPYVGRLFQAALGAIWAWGAYELLNNVFHYEKDVGLMAGLWENDKIWWWAIVIIDGLIFIMLHIAAFDKYLETLHFHKKSRLKNVENYYGDEYKNTADEEDEVILYSTFSDEDKAELQRELDRMNEINRQNRNM